MNGILVGLSAPKAAVSIGMPNFLYFYTRKGGMKALIGRKLGMSQIIDEDGNAVAVTFIHAGPCKVTQLKTEEKDGYSAVQLGWDSHGQPKKPQVGHLKPAGINTGVICEFPLTTDEEATKIGSSFDVSAFNLGDKVTISGTNKGKGFAGTVKRWNFNTGPKTHGSQNYRKPGSIGSMYPQKIFKGKKMAGHLGAVKTTIKNQTIVLIDATHNILGVKGTVPGSKKSLVSIRGGNNAS